MCGIAGIWNFDGPKINPSAIDKFTDSLAHRGPDGRGIWMDETNSIALGHRRLAILDLSDEGKQPMSYANGRYWLTYNGEIYNFIELREELGKKGHSFRSQSDTEVILAAYIAWGPEMLARFNGMWAFAIYDIQEKILFFARDRFGIKPFHYRYTSQQFSFASELKSFKYLEEFSPSIDKETASVFLNNYFGTEATERTLIHEVKRLLPGHYGILSNGKLSLTRWWNTLAHLTDCPNTMEEQAEKFREIFYDAMKIRMRSDVPIGTAMSGGFDSTAVACAVSAIAKTNMGLRQAKEWQQTFVATFPNLEMDERANAETTIEFAKIKGNFIVIKEQDAVEHIEKVLRDFDDLYFMLATPVWLVYKEMRRKNIVVTLDGHGLDELMGGYKPLDFAFFYNAPSLLSSPSENLSLIKNYLSCLPLQPKNIFHKAAIIQKTLFSQHPDFALLNQFSNKMNYFEKRFTHHSSLGFTHRHTAFEIHGQKDKLPEHWGGLNRYLYSIFHSTILPTLLRNYDRMSMANGVEIRMPFMDWRLVTYCFSLPESSKVSNGYTKHIARMAMKGKMPDIIRNSRAKLGFNSPIGNWLNGPLRNWTMEMLTSRNCLQNDLIDGKRFSDFVTKKFESPNWDWDTSIFIWSYLHYLWFEKEFLKQ